MKVDLKDNNEHLELKRGGAFIKNLDECEMEGNKVSSISSSPTDIEYPSAKAVFTFVKQEIGKTITETVSVEVASDVGDLTSQAVISIMINGDVVATGTGQLSVNIAYGTVYTISVNRIYDYFTPASQTFTAGQPVREVTMSYIYIPRDTITIDQTETDETAMVTASVNNSVIAAIRAASHRYLGIQTEEGNQVICQLKDTDGTKYYDDTTAVLDGSEGDQWMKLPEFWWKVTNAGTDVYSISWAILGEPDPTWHKWNGDKHLLGIHEMYVADNKGYSRSGIQSTNSFTQPQGKQYARNRGVGYTTVTWEWHCMMCALFYALYGRMNSQAQCGSGSNSYTRTLGTKDSFGMTDTTSANGNTDNTVFWGIENWWGCKYEWIDNITSQNYVLTVIDHDSQISRSVGTIVACGGTGNYIDKMNVTENLDFVPTSKEGSSTSSYCDYVNSNSGSRVVWRSGSSASPGGGVAFVNARYDSSNAFADIGSRLAFCGEIVEAESVAAYKAAINNQNS